VSEQAFLNAFLLNNNYEGLTEYNPTTDELYSDLPRITVLNKVRITPDDAIIAKFLRKLPDSSPFSFLKNFDFFLLENFCEVITFFGFFGLVLAVIYAVISEINWVSQFFNARVAVFFKKRYDKLATQYFLIISENSQTSLYYNIIFMHYFY
jgi:hypothetical protein